MTVKEQLILLLKENIGVYLSGEEIAERIGCSRGAVWKAVKTLESEGYNITGISNKGYSLSEQSDVLSEDEILKYADKSIPLKLNIHKTIDSTNSEVRRLAENGAAEWTVVIADEQTAGRGRAHRTFYSPAETGQYMSILLRPDMPANECLRITTAAAAATAEAIENVSGRKTGIKWVNDVYIDERKVCGILTEASFSMEDGRVSYIVLGIGVNLYTPKDGFNEEIKDIAGAVLDKKQWSLRNSLIAEIINIFAGYYNEISSGEYMKSYKEKLMWKGKEINIISASGKTPATLIDVDDECRLIVRLTDGTEKTIASDEISIRKEQ